MRAAARSGVSSVRRCRESIRIWKSRNVEMWKSGIPRFPNLLVASFVLVEVLVRGDVVDVDVVLRIERAPILVGVVETRDRALLDRAARLVALLLRLALLLRCPVRAEVLAPSSPTPFART